MGLAAWVTYNALTLVEFKPATAGPGIEISQILATKNLVATAFIEFWVISLVFLLCWKTLRKPLAFGFYVIGLIHSVVLIYDQVILRIPTGEAEIGLLGNRSIGASFAAVWVFFCFHFADYFVSDDKTIDGWTFFKKERRARFVKCTSLMGVTAILVSSSGISYLALLIGAIGLLWATRPKLAPWIAAPLGIVALCLAPFIKPEIFQHNVRYEAWPLFLTFWTDHFDWAFGSGLGTFRIWGPSVQMLYHFREGQWWLWMHSDWMQIGLELGLIGLVASLLVFGDALRTAFKRPYLFTSILCFGVVMLGNYPLHVPQFALFAWFLAFESMIGEAS